MAQGLDVADGRDQRSTQLGTVYPPWLSDYQGTAKNSFADGDGGGGKSPSLPPWLLPAPARVRVICKVATISNYWMMSRDCR